MIKQQAVWVFWNNNKLVNADYLRECLDDGWILIIQILDLFGHLN